MNDELGLRLLEEELKGKLSSLQKVDQNHKLYSERVEKEQQLKHSKKIQTSLTALLKITEKISKQYEVSGHSKKDVCHSFLYKQQIEDVFLEEESFTSALTSYTKKQFFEGISELAGSKDNTKYDLLDTNKPETLLIKGEADEIKVKEQEELKRLQSQYRESELTRIQSEMSIAGLKRKIEVAQKQLHSLNTQSHDFEENYNKNSHKKLSESIAKKKEELRQCFQSELFPLLGDLQNLHGVKILRGNYDLKIARQDYFLGKQSEVINQLLLQCSRNYFLSMLYEIELREHRKTYHLMASAKKLLLDEKDKIKRRIKLLQDPVLQSRNRNKETISSKDHFVNRFYDALLPNKEDEQTELYRTFSSLTDKAQMLSSQLEFLDKQHQDVESQKQKQLETLDISIAALQNVITEQEKGVQSKIQNMVGKLEDDLAIAEVQVNVIIKDVMSKKKTLANDSLKQLERSIFPNFFNDPSRLKRTMMEIQSRVQVF